MTLPRSAKTADKRILLFTNEDDPFGSFKGASKIDMTRTTLQRAQVCSSGHHFLLNFANRSTFSTKINSIVLFFFLCYIYFKDARDLGISIELLPLGRPEEEFNISLFYAVRFYLPQSSVLLQARLYFLQYLPL